jgi:hypothetical protein
VGLGPPADPATCAGGGSVRYVYRTKSGSWALYPVGGDRPGDLDRTTTSRGKDIPMIVRIETGIINRAPYIIAIPAEPGPDPSPGKPWPMNAWNGSLIYGAGDAFGLGVQGAARAGFFDVGRPAAAKSCAETLIGQGYAVAASATCRSGDL